MQGEFSIINKTKSKLPRLPFLEIKNDILGKDYSLSIAYVPEETSRLINKKYRNKNYPTNILSFCLKKDKGEIILCPIKIKQESKDDAKNFGKNFSELLTFLVIHGMLHLVGMKHSSTMEEKEKFYYNKYDKKHFNRNRCGILHDTSCGGRILERRKKS